LKFGDHIQCVYYIILYYIIYLYLTMANLRQKAVALFYLFGCGLLVPGSIYLKSPEDLKLAILLYIIACSFLTLAAVIDAVAAHLNKPKIGIENLTIKFNQEELKPDNSAQIHFIITIFYSLGGILFLTGSVLYWPDFENGDLPNIGTWVFRFGSCCYLVGSFMSIYSIFRKPFEKTFCHVNMLWLYVLLQYIVGALLFIVGGILSQLKMDFSVETWIIGSILFTGGATLGILITLFK
jgi:hypothetical protein